MAVEMERNHCRSGLTLLFEKYGKIVFGFASCL